MFVLIASLLLWGTPVLFVAKWLGLTYIGPVAVNWAVVALPWWIFGALFIMVLFFEGLFLAVAAKLTQRMRDRLL